MIQAAPRPDWSSPIHLLAFGLGSGAAPKAPGTFGTMAAIPLYLLLHNLSSMLYLLVVIVLFFVGIWLCGRTSRELGVHDHSGIVWDEWVGLLITLWLVPPGWAWLLTGFFLFRFFDILKPWPISWLDSRIGGGFGIMVDDLLAALYALTILQIAACIMVTGCLQL